MPTPTLRAHGAEIPALGFGTSPMTGAFSTDEVVTAFKAGYRHIDTARKYGTEREVGEAMRGLRRAARRDLSHHQGIT